MIFKKEAVADDAGQRILVSNGTVKPAQTVYDHIAAGALTDKTVTCNATATASGSPAGPYEFTITFTSTDAS